MSASDISAVFLSVGGVILSVAFIIFPKLKNWYLALPHQGIAMIGMVILMGVVWFGISCTPFVVALESPLECSPIGAFKVIQGIGLSIGTNKLTYEAVKLASPSLVQNGENQ